MLEDLPEEMKEKGTHRHHGEPTVMPEMFGEEKGVRFKLGPIRQSLKGMLGVRRVEEIDEAISGLESEPLKSALRYTKETHVEEHQSPEFRQEILNRNKTLRDLITEGSLTEKEKEIAEKLIGYNVRQLKKSERVMVGGVEELKSIREATERGAVAQEEALEAQKRAIGEEELPEEKEKQRVRLHALLELIEANDLPVAPVPGRMLYGRNPEFAQRIMTWVESERLDEELRREARARLRLQHCAAIAAAIPGRTEEAIAYLFNVFLEPESQRYALEAEDFHFLFSEEGEKIHGFKIREAWSLLQKAATEKLEIPEKREKVRYLGERMPAPIKAGLMREIQRRLVETIPEEPGVDREAVAKKSLQLAERLAIATRETSVWNSDIQGLDPLAEAIYLRKYRTKRAVRVRDRGPDITITRIEGFGTSFFRSAQDIRDKYIVTPDLDLRSLSEDPDAKRRITTMLELNRAPADERGEPKVDKLRRLTPERLNFHNLPEGSYMFYIGAVVPRILKAKDLLLQTTWKPEDFSSDAIESWVAPFDTADPYEITRLKTEFLLGAFYAVFSRPKAATDLHWDGIALKGVEDNLLWTFTIEEGERAGERVSFISQPQLSWIKENLKKGWRLNIEHEAAMVGVRTKITKRVI
ncbi:hypothetical protein KKI19_03335 [Patescibacteria group bacterium]|nr:hypothetical protein [Patescibacteria group bacterium]